MMYDYIWIFPLAFLLALFSVCWMIIGAGQRWIVKALLILLCASTGFMEWRGIESILGLPKHIESIRDLDGMTAELYHTIQKENVAIYLLLRPEWSKQPMLYSMPYSRKNAKGAQEAQDKLKSGNSLLVRFGQGGGTGSRQSGNGQTSTEEFFYILPPEMQSEK